ncbi:MAG: hypothetical protein K0Q48_3279 [Bacillota bacterium]|nr:hypothetical protein [Bacillota bacterium]
MQQVAVVAKMQKRKLLITIVAIMVIMLGAAAYLLSDKFSSKDSRDDFFDGEVTTAEFVSDYVPKPFDPVVSDDTLKYPGKWKGNVWPGLSQELERMGWTIYDAMGAVKYYQKEIDGQVFRFVVSVTEEGGPEEKDAVTLVRFSLIKDEGV